MYATPIFELAGIIVVVVTFEARFIYVIDNGDLAKIIKNLGEFFFNPDQFSGTIPLTVLEAGGQGVNTVGDRKLRENIWNGS